MQHRCLEGHWVEEKGTEVGVKSTSLRMWPTQQQKKEEGDSCELISRNELPSLKVAM